MKRRWLWVIVLLLCSSLFVACGQVSFSRKQKISFEKVVTVPDEAVIYMQNLAMMRDFVDVGSIRHLELVLPAKIILESIRLRQGDRPVTSFNLKKDRYTRVRISHVQKRIQPNKPLIVEYLTWGLHWNAQYRIDVLKGKKLNVQLGAMVHNNWYDLSGVKVTLVAGRVGSTLSDARLPLLDKPNPVRLSTLSGAAVAMVGSHLPAWLWLSRPAVSAGSYRFQYQQRMRALHTEYVRKYKIRRIDRSGIHLKSNYEKQMSRYYKLDRTARHGTGYATYKPVMMDIRRGEKSFAQVANILVPGPSRYVWLADQTDDTSMLYHLRNRSNVLLPTGMAWLYRKGIYIGQDVCTWTPAGTSAFLTTSNDGNVSVSRRVFHRKGDVEETRLSMQNVSNHPITIEVFDRNPLYRRKGKATFSIKSIGFNERAALVRWKITLPANSKKAIIHRFVPAPVVKELPKAPVPRTPPVQRKLPNRQRVRRR
jgi:hypothetical protein